MLNDLKELIAIKSVMDAPEENAPFGAACKQALDWFLAKADSFGLRTGQQDGYCGWAEYGEGDEMIAALCHLDVVPAGEDWSSDPYNLLIENGFLYGRGVTDDKGAAVMCLHALKEIKESKVALNKRIRVIVGLNEEHGSECMKHYVKHCEIPSYSFVPDADFPVINSEKGILHLKVRVPLDRFFEGNIAYISGSGSINVVPDRASLSIFNDSPLYRKLIEAGNGKITNEIFKSPCAVGCILAAGHHIEDYSVRVESDVITIEASGVSGHAMAPDKADNAVWKLFSLLSGLTDKSEIVSCLNEYFCSRLSAEKLGIYKYDEESGDTTISLGMIDVDDKNLNFTLDIRLCLSSDYEDVIQKVLKVLPAKSKAEILKYSPNLFIPKDSPLVASLLEVYKEVTNQDTYCLRCGGGTYARELPNAAAFGPTFPEVSTNIHKPDECFPIEDFYKAFKIYKQAFIKLALN